MKKQANIISLYKTVLTGSDQYKAYAEAKKALVATVTPMSAKKRVEVWNASLKAIATAYYKTRPGADTQTKSRVAQWQANVNCAFSRFKKMGAHDRKTPAHAPALPRYDKEHANEATRRAYVSRAVDAIATVWGVTPPEVWTVINGIADTKRMIRQASPAKAA